MPITLTKSQIEALDEWKEGEHYKVEAILRQVTPSEDGEATFQIVGAEGSRADPREIEQFDKPTFKEAHERSKAEGDSEKKNQEVLRPQSGSTPIEDDG